MLSFSLYLIHPTVIENLGIPLLQFEGLKPALTGFPYVIFLTVLSVCVAYPFRVLVERRLSNFCETSSYPSCTRRRQHKTEQTTSGHRIDDEGP